MDSIISLVGGDFVLSAADTGHAQSVVVMKQDMDKIMALDEHKILSIAGEWGDAVQFTEYVQKNVHLYELRTGITMSTPAVANYTRNWLAKSIRSNPYNVNLLLGGWDKTTGPSLYFLDYLGTCHPMKYSAQGYASFFVQSTLDRHWREGMSLDEALDVMRKCIAEVSMRFVINQPSFTAKVVDKDGVRIVKL